MANNSSDSPLLLRVKRQSTETPVEYFSTFNPPKKRRRIVDILGSDEELNLPKCFRYIGSTTSETSVPTTAVGNGGTGDPEELKVLGAAGARRIYFSSNSIAHIIDSQTKQKVPYNITISGCKRNAHPAPHAVSEDCDDSSDADDLGLPPSKQLRVIDLQRPSKDSLAMTLNGVRLSTSQLVTPPKKETSDYVYDVYRIHKSSGESPESDYLTYEDEDNDDRGREFGDDDDSDSNSESNWRNDYPDEDDISYRYDSHDDFSDDQTGGIFEF